MHSFILFFQEMFFFFIKVGVRIKPPGWSSRKSPSGSATPFKEDRVACQPVQVPRRIVCHTCIIRCENKGSHSTKMASVVSTILPVKSCEFYSTVGLGSLHEFRWPSIDRLGPANHLESGIWNDCMSILTSVTASRFCLRLACFAVFRSACELLTSLPCKAH